MSPLGDERKQKRPSSDYTAIVQVYLGTLWPDTEKYT